MTTWSDSAKFSLGISVAGLLCCASAAGQSVTARQNPALELILPGTVVPAPGTQTTVLAPFTARVLYATDPPKDTGDLVQAGEPLCILEHHFNYHDLSHLFTERWPLQKEFLAARRKSLEARLELERARYLYKTGTVALREVQEAESRAREAAAEWGGAQKRLAQHDVQIAKSDLTRSPIMAPISGRIVEAAFHQGQLVYEGDKLYTILDISKVRVQAEVFESDLAQVLKYKTAVARVTALPRLSLEVRLIGAGVQVKESSRTISVFYEAANPGEALKIGMLVTLSVARPVGSEP